MNKVMLIGNLGSQPDIRVMQSGEKIANLSLATSESWKDKNTGEKKTITQWHRVVIFNQAIVDICQQYIAQGDKVCIEGALEHRSYEKDGETKYVTEVVLRNFNSNLIMLTPKGSKAAAAPTQGSVQGAQAA
jgi:single-strand DNA-binding protein